ncbi:hypothetical protein C8J57DRAFT_391488 [Mycena rebaudengoi]|nr:hypothetical protein C8J57DRAFT_391488 [Mycena rebaudengoi]
MDDERAQHLEVRQGADQGAIRIKRDKHPLCLPSTTMAALPQLPQVPLGLPAHGVPPPNVPAQNPPTLIDVTNAHDYNERLAAARNATRHGKCENYNMRFLTTSRLQVPAVSRLPLRSTSQRVSCMRRRSWSSLEDLVYLFLLCPYNTLTSFLQGAMPAWFQAWDANEFQPLKDAVDAIRIDLATFRAQFANGQCATGHQAPFDVVLFVSGDDPTDGPHNLPAIQNTTDMTALTPAALTSYLTGYGLSAQGNPVVRTRRLARHIGYFGPL